METLTRLSKIEALARKIEIDTKARFITDGYNPENHKFNATIKPGKKYTKVDIGDSGKYMIDADGNIFGIKAYGVIHFGHQYGTLDTINEWNWGGYTAKKTLNTLINDRVN